MKNMKNTKKKIGISGIFLSWRRFSVPSETKKPGVTRAGTGSARGGERSASRLDQGATFITPFMIAQWPG